MASWSYVRRTKEFLLWVWVAIMFIPENKYECVTCSRRITNITRDVRFFPFSQPDHPPPSPRTTTFWKIDTLSALSIETFMEIKNRVSRMELLQCVHINFTNIFNEIVEFWHFCNELLSVKCCDFLAWLNLMKCLLSEPLTHRRNGLVRGRCKLNEEGNAENFKLGRMLWV